MNSKVEILSSKHLEIVIRQMFTKRRIIDPGDSLYTTEDMISDSDYTRTNEELKKDGKALIKSEPLIIGITGIANSRQGFLSSASFQGTKKVLINAAIEGIVDNLKGLKENIIVGRLVPAGTGYKGSNKNKIMTEFQENLDDQEEEVMPDK